MEIKQWRSRHSKGKVYDAHDLSSGDVPPRVATDRKMNLKWISDNVQR